MPISSTEENELCTWVSEVFLLKFKLSMTCEGKRILFLPYIEFTHMLDIMEQRFICICLRLVGDLREYTLEQQNYRVRKTFCIGNWFNTEL